VTSSVTFLFPVEIPSGEQLWTVTADITFEHGRYFTDLTGAHPEGEKAAEYDVSDLEDTLLYDGRLLADVEQAAIDAYVEQATREGERRECDLERVGT
jgi:hypothetical protein